MGRCVFLTQYQCIYIKEGFSSFFNFWGIMSSWKFTIFFYETDGHSIFNFHKCIAELAALSVEWRRTVAIVLPTVAKWQ